VIQTAATYQLREASQALKAGYEKVSAGTEDTLCEAGLGLARLSESIAQQTQWHLGAHRSEVVRLAQAVTLKAQAGLQAAGRDLNYHKAQAGRDATRLLMKAADDLNCDLAAVAGGAGDLVEAALKEIEASTRLVIGLGPQATLRRGFAIARDDEGRPVTSREEAVQLPSFQVQFHDGMVPVSNQDHEGGAGR
jgi:exodeoxyribonuclease VII large subunit